MKKNCLLAFIISFVIIMTMFIVWEVGISKNLLYSDYRIEYYPFLHFLKHPSFYSFNNGIGDSMVGIIAYYLLSPFNILVYLFNNGNMLDVTYLLVFLKAAVSSVTMFIYLSYHFKSEDKTLLVFSIIYSLSGYIINFYFNIIWLDSYYMLPLVIYSLERFINEDKPILYLFILALTIIMSYYIGYMICLFLCIYFVYYIFVNNVKNKGKLTLKFIIYSLLGGLLCSFILIPTLYDLVDASRLSILNNMNYDTNIFNVLSRFYFLSSDSGTVLNFDLISVYSSLMSLPLVFIYFVKAEKREKILSILLLLVMLLPVFISFLNRIWHGLNYPNFFNFRFSFIIIFIIIIFAYNGYKLLDKTKIQHFIIYFSIFLLLSMCMMFKRYDYLSSNLILINILVTLVYLVILILIRYKKISSIFMFLVLFELLANGIYTFQNYQFRSNESFYNYYESILNVVKVPEENEFYRYEKNYYDKIDENYIYGNYGITNFTSTMKMNIIDFFNKCKLRTNNQAIYYGTEATPILNSLLNLKYISIVEDDNINEYSKMYDIDSSGAYALHSEVDETSVKTFLNKNDLSLGYIINDYKEINSNGIEYQIDLLSNALGKEIQSMKEVDEVRDLNKVYYFEIKNEFKNSDFFTININDESYYFSNATSKIILLNNLQLGRLNIEIVDNHASFDIEYKLYEFDKDVYDEEISLMENNIMTIDTFKHSYIKGKINASKDDLLFTSIPYNKGWKVYVNGKEKDVTELYDAFVGVKLEEGENTLEFKFVPRGLRIGVVISLIDLLIIIVIMRRKK